MSNFQFFSVLVLITIGYLVIYESIGFHAFLIFFCAIITATLVEIALNTQKEE